MTKIHKNKSQPILEHTGTSTLIKAKKTFSKNLKKTQKAHKNSNQEKFSYKSILVSEVQLIKM